MIPFNQPYPVLGKNLANLYARPESSYRETVEEQVCSKLIAICGGSKILLTNSCTSALETACLATRLSCPTILRPKIIVPAFTYVSSANAIVRAGCEPVFCDVGTNSRIIDMERLLELVTDDVIAVLVVNYGNEIFNIEELKHHLANSRIRIIEDAAQVIGSRFRGKLVGGIADFSCLSFHETKNIHCGQGGALIVNCGEQIFQNCHEIINKGTNRLEFDARRVSKYDWVQIGSNFKLSEICMAVLDEQLDHFYEIQERRISYFNEYIKGLNQELAKFDFITDCSKEQPATIGNGHLYFIQFSSLKFRGSFIEKMKLKGVMTPFHYQNLSTSPYGSRFASVHDYLENTDRVSSGLVRLPIWIGIENFIDKIINDVLETLREY